MASKNNYGVGTNDLYGVQEAERRKQAFADKSKSFADMEQQNIYTQNQAKYQKKRSDWANTNSVVRQGYEQNDFDFAGAKDLSGYFNDAAGAYHGGKRKGSFGQKDYDYLKKMGAQDDVIANYIGSLEGKNIHENFRNNDLAKHVHADGFAAGAHFNKHDRDYITKNNLSLVDEALKYGKSRGEKGAHGHADKATIDALREAGKLQEYDSYFARGHDKEKGISSYQQGKHGFNHSDIAYLERQGYSKEDITNHMASLRDGKDGGKGVSMNVHASNWLHKNNMLDTYSNWKAPNEAASEAKDRAQEHINKPKEDAPVMPLPNVTNDVDPGSKPPTTPTNPSNNNNNSNNNMGGFPDLTRFYTQMPGSNSGNNSNNSGGSNNNSSGGIDLSQFMTPMGGSSGNNNSSSSGGLDLSQFMTPMGGSSGNNNSSSSGGLDLSGFMTPMGDSSDNKNKYNGSLDLSKYMNNY
jgi:hypothetical protein